MGTYKEIYGNLITLAQQGNFDVISHGCNCFCTMGAGIAPQMAKAFGCDKFPLEDIKYRGDINKLGQIDFQTNTYAGGTSEFNVFDFDLTVINSYTQYGFGSNHSNGTPSPIDYDALTLCMRKINHNFKGKRIGLPMIGAGLAGGIWDINQYSKLDTIIHKKPHRLIKTIIQEELKDCDVTIAILKKD